MKRCWFCEEHLEGVSVLCDQCRRDFTWTVLVILGSMLLLVAISSGH